METPNRISAIVEPVTALRPRRTVLDLDAYDLAAPLRLQTGNFRLRSRNRLFEHPNHAGMVGHGDNLPSPPYSIPHESDRVFVHDASLACERQCLQSVESCHYLNGGRRPVSTSRLRCCRVSSSSPDNASAPRLTALRNPDRRSSHPSVIPLLQYS